MEMVITFPGGVKVDASFGPYTVHTDQPARGGGEGSAPSPFSLFLAALGTCAGLYVLRFCQQRNLPTEGIRLIQRTHSNPETDMVEKVELEIQVPEDFPEKYRPALAQSAKLCAVKKHLDHPPDFQVFTKVAAPEG